MMILVECTGQMVVEKRGIKHKWIPIILVGVFSTYFIDSLNGWFAEWSASYWDAGSILRTNDGGKSWKTVLLTYMLNLIYCIDSLNCFAAGFDWISKQGVLLITNDGWKKYKEICFTIISR